MNDAGEFFQDAPVLGNQYRGDAALQAWLKAYLPAEILKQITPGLDRLGARAAGDMLAMAADADAHPPQHVPYDPWGRRIDRIDTTWGWQALRRVAAEEGIVATAYERREAAWSRLHQFVRLYLYHPSAAMASCPLAMTDGAARVLEVFGDQLLKQRYLPRLLSRDPAAFWTSGQWMTERSGGSDVSGTSTTALLEKGAFRLHGTKWFTSATDSQLAVTLARDPEAGDKLSLFLLELRDAEGRLNGIFVHRLKDKLGTRALPTAELTLAGTPALRIGEPGHGVRNIATVLNITRLYNAVCAVSYMRRGLALAEDYARKRRAFGKLLSEHPLHRETLAELHAEFVGALHLVLHLGVLLGREETAAAGTADRILLRLLTPVAKLFTGKQSIAVVSEVLECFGGQGYIEDTGLPVLLRDCQVLSIWEGTTNVLSLDVLRVLDHSQALEVLVADVDNRLARLQLPELAPTRDRIRQALQASRNWFDATAGSPTEREAGARRFAFSLARSYTAVLLAGAVQDGWLEGDILQRWCRAPLAQV
ncbi:MAG: acyl-CoA dehydrogenase family protein [Gammaproteobacteria bacterium]|nr:acyl-CoA dehydrogenase family protein [Gammaproteobacteria bacterium]MDE2024287.1 acyl-CoA dehydrogenase family protein [Gammaproteobacteria bacterium]